MHFRPSWTADGKSLIYMNDLGSGAGQPSMSRADGTGAPRQLLHSALQFAQAFETRDGQVDGAPALVRRNRDRRPLRRQDGDTTLVPLLTTPAREMSPAVSPDGRWLAYVSDESGQPEVYVRPFPDVATARWQVSASGGTLPVWAHNGRELFYLNGRQELTTIPLTPGAELRGRAAAGAVPGGAVCRWPATPASYDVSPDDKRFVFVRAATGGTGTELVVVQNWFEELRGRVGK